MMMRNNNHHRAGRNPSVDTNKMDRPQRGPFKGLRSKKAAAPPPPPEDTIGTSQHAQHPTTRRRSQLHHHAVDDLEISSSSNRRKDDFLPNPKILDSPGGKAPQKKIWEGAYNNFLSLGKSARSSPNESDLSKSPDTKKSSFTILPGTKRLVTQVPSLSDAYHRQSLPGSMSAISQPGKQHVRAQSMTHGEGGVRQRSDSGDSDTRPHSFFRGRFGRSTSDGSVALSRRSRNHSNGSSPDDLDSAMRHGMNKHSPEYNHIPRKQASPPMFHPSSLPNVPSLPNVQPTSQEDVPHDLDALLAGASVSPHYTVETAGMPRIPSYGIMQPMSESVDSISGHYPYYLPKRESTGSFNYNQAGLYLEDDSFGNSSQSSELHSSQRSKSTDQQSAKEAAQQQGQSPKRGGMVGSLLAQQVAAHAATEMDQQQHRHHYYEQQQAYPQHVQYRPMYAGQYPPPMDSNGHFNGAPVMMGVSPNFVVGSLDTNIMQHHDPNFHNNSNSNSPSSLLLRQGQESPPVGVDPEKKKMFTAFHNQARFARDSTSAFLGGESPTAHQHSYAPTYHMMMAGGGISVPQQAYSAMDLPSMAYYSTSLPLETVDEQNISIHKTMRVLKPVQGTASWEAGRRYLIAPAAMAACPLTVINRLSGGLIQNAQEAAESSTPQAFGTIDLGECLMTYIGETHHLSLGQWSSCRLVLRQNYLLEFDATSPITGPPRGYIHLQHARASMHADFQNALELDFFASPCAKADRRMLMIRAETREECGYWIKCLNRAAQLNIDDLWDFDGDLEFGRGRYAAVYPARRKTEKYHLENPDGTASSAETSDNSRPPSPDKESALAKYDCALKVIDKAEFWRRVVKGRERADTLVRETSVQAALTAKCGKIGTFLQLRGFFETSQNVVIELELLEGTDLFKHISSRGVLPEHEAAIILRDMLTSLEAMNRVGLAHRDIKPANVLMCDREKCGVSVKIGDFGMSTFVGVDGLARGRCGTPGYAAPELLTGGSRVGYSNEVDVFSAGVTLYVMLCGYEPFYGETENDLIASNKRARVEFPEDDWGRISNDARDLVKKMTHVDPLRRISAKDALKHPWITRLDDAPAPAPPQQEDNPDPAGGSKGSRNVALTSADVPMEGACVIS